MTPFEQVFFYATMALYVLGALLFTYEFLRQKETKDQEGKSTQSVAAMVTAVGFLAHTIALLLRCYVTGYAPMTNMYESLSFFSWCTVGTLFIVRRWMALPFISAFTAPLYVVLIALAYFFSPQRVPTLVPALQSWLLPAHVMLAFMGEAWFVLGFAAAVMYLVRIGQEETNREEGFILKRLPSAEVLDTFSYRAISLGYPLFTFGALVLGMVWAHKAWGRYWGWDPKEVWALITFFVYSLYLHGRYRWGWRGKVSAYLAVVGFAVTMFTLFGVNLLLSGLHSYATGG